MVRHRAQLRAVLQRRRSVRRPAPVPAGAAVHLTAEVPEWRRLVDRAKHLISLKRPEDARKLAAKAIALAPGESRAFCVLAIATSDMGEHEQALEHAARAIALEPTLDWPHRVRGYVFLEMKRYQDAVEAGQEAVRLAPTDAHGFNLLAGALRLAGRLEEAETAAERLRELAPEWFVTDLVQQGVSNEPMDPWHRSSLESVRERRSNARFATRALILIFLGGSVLFGIEAFVEWRKQHSPQAYVMGCISLAALLLSLLFLSWLPHGLGPTFRRRS